MNWETAVWRKGKEKKTQARYLKNICTEQADRPMHLYLRSERDPSQLILHQLPLVQHCCLRKLSAPGAKMCPRHSQNAVYSGLNSSWDNRHGGCIAKFIFSMRRRIHGNSPRLWLAAMQYVALWILTIFLRNRGFSGLWLTSLVLWVTGQFTVAQHSCRGQCNCLGEQLVLSRWPKLRPHPKVL